MTDKELYSRAVSAAHAYRKFYGRYPHKIGIDWCRLQTFPYRAIHIPELVGNTSMLGVTDILSWVPPRVKINEVSFGPINLDYNEAYFIHPDDPDQIISAEHLLFIASSLPSHI